MITDEDLEKTKELRDILDKQIVKFAITNFGEKITVNNFLTILEALCNLLMIHIASFANDPETMAAKLGETFIERMQYLKRLGTMQ